MNIDKSIVNLEILEKVDINRESELKVRLYQGLPKLQKWK